MLRKQKRKQTKRSNRMKALTLQIWVYMLGVCIALMSCNQQASKTPSQTFPSIIEVIGENEDMPLEELVSICEKHGINTTSLYSWKNHFIVFDFISETAIESIKSEFAATAPTSLVKVYENPFYVFDRSKCSPDDVAQEWSHTIMTANLVQDTTMQKEYMDYHATQYEEWSEVSYGFCKAGFQQLLMFRNGRQLMLIISIPKGESLDELDPKTTEDNPRVNDWNAIMAKYQEGVDGTMPDEKWVVFNSLMNY